MHKKLLSLIAGVGLTASSFAVQFTPVGITGTGTYNNNENLIIDGIVPAETTGWQNAQNVWWNGTAVEFVIDLGSVNLLRDILVSVDNNDTFEIASSLDNAIWTTLAIILPGYGEIPVVPGGMDTMSSDAASLEYLPAMEFAAHDARYIRIRATGGDNNYSIGELQAFGDIGPGNPTPNPVPDSGSSALLALSAFGALIALRKRLS